MSLDRCIADVSAELGLDEKDVREIADRLKKHKQRRQAEGRLDRLDEELRQFAADEAQKARIAAALKRKQAALNIILRDEWDADVGEMMGQGASPQEAVLAKLVGSYQGITKARKSAAARRVALEGEWLGGLERDIMRDLPHIFPLLKNPRAAKPLMDAVEAEMRELKPNGRPGVSGSKDAQALAKILATYAEASRLELNRVGANIGKLDGWSPQSHDVRKMLRAGRDAWVQHVMPLLDLERSFPGKDQKEVAAILWESYDNIVFGRDPALSPIAKGERIGPANLARSLEHHRVLHFKDAAAKVAYNDRFGRGNVFTAMLDHLHGAARKASVMSTMGPNPQAFTAAFVKSLASKVRNQSGLPEATRQKWMQQLGAVDLDNPTRSAIGKAFAEVMGDTYIPGNVTAGRISSQIRAVQSMAKLGGAVISSVTDLVTYAHGMRFQGKGILQGYADGFGALFKGKGSADKQRLALTLGVGFDSILGDIHARFMAEDNMPGWHTRATQAFFRFSGLTWWTDVLTNAYARMSASWMAQHADRAWEALPDAYRHVLDLHGLSGTRWEIARQALYTADDGVRYITPDAVRDLPDEAFDALLPLGATDARKARLLTRARRELEMDLRAFFSDEAAFGVIKGDDRTRMFITQGTQPGTTLGEAMRFIMQFKTFPIAYTQKILGRTLRGNVGRQADYGALAELIAASFIFGYAAMTVKDVLKNKTHKDPMRLETWLAAFLQGGGAGIYGDFLFGKANRFGNAPLETLAGPTLGTGADIVSMFQKAMAGEAKASDAFWTALNNTPFVNLWYTRIGLDFLILNQIQEWLSPGTFRRREREMQKQYGQRYMFEPV